MRFRFGCMPIPGQEDYEIYVRHQNAEGLLLSAADPITKELMRHIASLHMRGELDAVLRISPRFVLLIGAPPLPAPAWPTDDEPWPNLLKRWQAGDIG